ncbi:MAG TPA: Gfo/Idh/MocA family oxidoreductase [Opitutaceae bacterium]|nr:Gfo/Idh/MocA family oxidoreductase [Opitutaceae bacterium]
MTKSSPSIHSAAVSAQSRPSRFAYVGTGGRVRMFLDPVAQRYAAEAQIVALCDLSLVRAAFHRDRLKAKFNYAEVPVYAAANFGQMLREAKPDTVVVCTIDGEHHRYIVEALRAGCNVVTEKPMTTDAAKCRAIFDAVRETGRTVRVAFNYRWNPGATKVRELLAQGTIGQVRHVTMEYLLNTSHGADYFRRWHAHKDQSGGLLVHKSTHHFDLVNWWIDAVPADVFAQGALMFYGRENAVRRGDEALTSYPRYYQQPVDGDPFAYTYEHSMIRDPAMEHALYLGAAERETGYVRDQNVFRPDIDIEDVMNVLVRYRNGTLLNYSLNAFSPYEGYRVAFNGDRGRLEYREFHAAHIVGEGRLGAEHEHGEEHELRVFPHFKPSYAVPVPVIQGDHGGGDPLLQEQIFSAHPPIDPFGRSAGHEQGAASILIGIAANTSIASRQPVAISSLLPLNPSAQRLSELV